MTQIDLTQILKNCPVGTKLYSPIFGEVTFQEITDRVGYSIDVKLSDDTLASFMKDGRYYHTENAECLLFPSKDNRDWSTFKVEQMKFEPFQKVLVRDTIIDRWEAQIYSVYDERDIYPHICMGAQYKQCIPYEGNERLLGTTDAPKH